VKGLIQPRIQEQLGFLEKKIILQAIEAAEMEIYGADITDGFIEIL